MAVLCTSHCVCGANFTADHTMICRHGGLTFIRHNELCDITTLKFAMTFPLNHHSSLSVGRDSLPGQLINRMMQEQIFMPVFFGDGNKVPFLI